MTRLRCSMHNKRRADRSKERVNARTVANIEFVMMKHLISRLEPALIPSVITAGAEEIGAHVVIDAVNRPTFFGKVVHNFRTDEAGRTSNK